MCTQTRAGGDGGRACLWRGEVRARWELLIPSTLYLSFDFADTTYCTSCDGPDTTTMAKSTPGQPPAEMFTIVKSTAATLSPRLGRLSLPGRNAIETPHYLGLTSRGVIPHLSQDNLARLSSISGVYAALEDCEFLASSIPLAPTR